MDKRSSEAARSSWSEVVLAALRSDEKAVSLAFLYRHVELKAPELVAANPHWRDKVRQVVQRLRDKGLAVNVDKGMWQAARPDVGAQKRAA